MKARQVLLDANTVAGKTAQQNRRIASHLETANKVAKDTEQKFRQKSQQCKYCYYLNHNMLSGQAFTERPCGICAEQVVHSNTAAPLVCKPCAVKHSLCVTCGSDLELRPRRKKFDWKPVPVPVDTPGRESFYPVFVMGQHKTEES